MQAEKEITQTRTLHLTLLFGTVLLTQTPQKTKI